MKFTAITLSILVLFGSCTSYKYSNKTVKEEVVMASLDYKDPVTLQKVLAQNNPSEVSRGFVSSDMLIQGANLAIQGVKYLIDESKKKYVAEYTGGIHNENFYATNSKSGMLDPEGIQFKGFVFERKFADKKKETLDAVKIAVSLDESKMEDLYFNARFYLKLDSAVIDYAKVKLNDKKWYIPWTWFIKKQTTFNLDMEINILANWLDETGSIHSDVPFGKFILPLRNIPVDPNSDARKVYFEKLKNTRYFPANNYATFCAIQGKFREAEQYYEKKKFVYLSFGLGFCRCACWLYQFSFNYFSGRSKRRSQSPRDGLLDFCFGCKYCCFCYSFFLAL
jgi:hypothetical protein